MTTPIADGPLGPRRYAPPREAGAMRGLRATGLLIEEPPVPRLLDLSLWLAVGVSALLIGWVLFVRVGDPRSLEGTPLPPAETVTLAAPADGTLTALSVRNEEIVVKGQALARIQPGSVDDERADLRKRAVQAGLDIETLNALAEGRDPDYAKFGAAPADLVAAAKASHAAFIARRETERTAATRSRDENLSARDANDVMVQVANAQLSDLDRQLQTRMSSAGTATLRAQRDEAKADVVRLTAEQIRIANAIERAEQTLSAIDRRYATAANEKARQVLTVYNDIRGRIEALDKAGAAAALTAPAEGIVTLAAGVAAGQAIKAGAPILTLTPATQATEIGVTLPDDVHLSTGDRVTVDGASARVTAIDGARATLTVDDAARRYEAGKMVSVVLPGSRQPIGAMLAGLLRPADGK